LKLLKYSLPDVSEICVAKQKEIEMNEREPKIKWQKDNRLVQTRNK
jgi:hypothetical protein